MPDDNSPEKYRRERERMERLVKRLKEAAGVPANFHASADLNDSWMELERLLVLDKPHWSEMDLAIVRAKVLLERTQSS